MTDKFKGMFILSAALLALVVGGAALAGAAAGGDPVPGGAPAEPDDDASEAGGHDDDAGEAGERVRDRSKAERAGAAALRAVGGEGKVTEVEVADEGDSSYEVEVKRSNGGYAEVGLDRAFGVRSVEADDD